MTPSELVAFELELAQICMKMTDRGILIDEPRRLDMMQAVRDEVVPLRQELTALVLPIIDAKWKKIEALGKTQLFEDRWTCSCCRGGAKKVLECWSCAGLKKAPSASEKRELGPLGPCEVCEGVPKKVIRTYNPTSVQQNIIVLYHLLMLPKRLKKKKLTVEEDKLKTLLPKDKSGIVQKLLFLAKVETMESKFKGIAPGPDGRIRTFYNVTGTETFRLSASGGKPFPTGTERFALEVAAQLHNLAKRVAARNPKFNVRRCLVPDTGNVFIAADLKQAEAMIVAAAEGNEELLRSWDDPSFDIHRWAASIAFDKPEPEVTKDERNFIGKTIRHAASYGMQPKKYMEEVNAEADITGYVITLDFAKRGLERMYEEDEFLRPWWRKVYDRLGRGEQLENCFGRRRTFFGRRNAWACPGCKGSKLQRYEDGIIPMVRCPACTRRSPAPDWLDGVHREAIADEPQSTVGMLLNMGLVNWNRKHDGVVGTLHMQTHDEALIQAPKARVGFAARLLKQSLEIPITVNGYDFTIPAEVSYSKESFGEMEEMEI